MLMLMLRCRILPPPPAKNRFESPVRRSRGSGHGTPTGGGAGMMATSMVLPTPLGRGGPHRHGVHRTRSRNHTAHKVLH